MSLVHIKKPFRLLPLQSGNPYLKMTKVQSIILPDILAKWPWQRRLNYFHDEVKKEAQAWARSFRVCQGIRFSDQADIVTDVHAKGSGSLRQRCLR